MGVTRRVQEVQGFPTVKVFPRGGQLPGQRYEGGERTSSNLIKWASRSVPNKIKVLPSPDDIPEWLDKVCVLGLLVCLFFPPPRIAPFPRLHVESDPVVIRKSTCHASFFSTGTRNSRYCGRSSGTTIIKKLRLATIVIRRVRLRLRWDSR